MYVKSIVIEGFKSYASRTEITGFDPQFNAITGLNGSGKSNILDSICFVLGISNLTQVRVSNLQELIYKSGQAGINKAVVSVTFDNTDKEQSPLGYAHADEITVTRQIVLGGRNKYKVNGVNATNNRVEDLFRSVQLNVNNPHFLIMQGRITKVLNMKPAEILSLIEEAAGTRLYDDKKEEAKREIAKKTQKLHDDETLIKEQLEPRMAKMEKERQTYIEYQKLTREREHVDRVCTAYRYYAADQLKAESSASVTLARSDCDALKQKLADIQETKSKLKKEITEIEKELDKRHSGALEEARKATRESETILSVCRSDVEEARRRVDEETTQSNKIEKERKKDMKTIESKRTEMVALTGGEKSAKALEAAQARHDAASAHVDALTIGVASGKKAATNHRSLEATLAELNQQLTEADTEMKRLQMSLKSDEQHLNAAKAQLKNGRAKTDFENLTKEVAANQKLVAEAEAELKAAGGNSEADQSVLSNMKELNVKTQQMRDRIGQIESRFPRLAFEYRDPEPNFDRSRVIGVVAKLFKMNDPKHSVALEEAASGKLFNVVVDSDQTGKLLLQHGDLRQRVTLIPLNKIQPFTIPEDVVRFAQKTFGADRVFTALSLITPESNKTLPALQFVFGGTLVCTDANIARQVAYHERIQRRVVTLQGDVFDPSGVISGGSRGNREDILAAVSQIQTVQSEMVEVNKRLAVVQESAAKLKQKQEVASKVEMAQHRLHLSEERLRQTAYGLAEIEAKRLETELTTKRARIDELGGGSGTIGTLRGQIADVEKRIADYNPERELAAAKKEFQEAKKELNRIEADVDQKRSAADSLRADIDALEAGIAGHDKRLEELTAALERHKVKLNEATAKATAAERVVDKCRATLNEAEKSVADVTAAIREKAAMLTRKDEERNETEVAQEEARHRLSRAEKGVTDATSVMQTLSESHDWIEAERRYFGQPGSMYDFSAKTFQPAELASRSSTIAQAITKLEKRLNPQVMAQLKRTEEDYRGAMERRQTVLRDREKLLTTMSEVDEARNDAIWAAYKRVNTDFADIFSTLLPGARAMLAANEASVNSATSSSQRRKELVGVEFRVGFGNDAWKESLSELSGGQRSLVALSLILALLRYRPAPLYILDEIDAALDLSHTQNIGRIIREYFKSSQFIIVSLKEGMFSNANVIFQTRFQDGVSTVARHVGRQAITGREKKKTREDERENSDGPSEPAAHSRKRVR